MERINRASAIVAITTTLYNGRSHGAITQDDDYNPEIDLLIVHNNGHSSSLPETYIMRRNDCYTTVADIDF